MQNQQPLSQTQTRIEELRQQSEMMDLALEVAFKEQLYLLLKNKDSDPGIVLDYLKMNEKREAQKLKAFMAKLKGEIELNEKLAERRLVLEERKQALNERKFNHETQDLPEQEPPTPQPVPSAPAPAKVPAQPQLQPTSTLVKSTAPVSQVGSSREKSVG